MPEELEYASLDDVNAGLKRHRQLQKLNDRRTKTEKRRIAREKKRAIDDRAGNIEEQQQIEAAIKQYVTRNRTQLSRQYRKTITLPEGVITYRINPLHLIGPKNSVKLITFLLKMRGGKRYLTFTPTINRDAIAQSRSRLLRQRIAPFGFKIGVSEILSIKPHGYDDPIQLDEKPVNRQL